jgi:SAM-dependent methyltransferase
MHSQTAVQEDITYNKFAQYYDAIYGERDYQREVQRTTELLKKFSAGGREVCHILELGCGTGAHTLRFTHAGYNVLGVDRSAQMLAAARRKAGATLGRNIDFRLLDIRAMEFEKEFDACISLFGCMSYLSKADDLQRAISAAGRALRPHGLFIFDFWNADAVAAQKPSVRQREVKLGQNGTLVRTATPTVDWETKICTLNYRIHVYKDQQLVDSFEEAHHVRFFTPREMEQELERAGFQVLEIRVPDGDIANREQSWFLLAVARPAPKGRRSCSTR